MVMATRGNMDDIPRCTTFDPGCHQRAGHQQGDYPRLSSPVVEECVHGSMIATGQALLSGQVH